VPEVLDQELAALVRERLDAREPRRLPARFTPPARRVHLARWVVGSAVAGIVVGLAVAALIRPDVGSAVLSGVFDRPRAATPHAPQTPRPAPSGGRPGSVPGTAPRPSTATGTGPTAQPAPTASPAPPGGGPSTGPAPTAQPSSGGPLPIPLPSLPVPLPSLPPLPLPSLPPVLPSPLPSLPLPTRPPLVAPSPSP
jgi:hypothetical protein